LAFLKIAIQAFIEMHILHTHSVVISQALLSTNALSVMKMLAL